MTGIIGVIEQSESNVTIISVLLFLISLCTLKIVHNVYFAPKNIQGYTAAVFIVLFMVFVIGYQHAYEVKEYNSSYEKLNNVKNKIKSVYGEEYINRFDSVNVLINSSLQDNKITANEHDYILDSYLIIVETIEEEMDAKSNDKENHKQKLKNNIQPLPN